MRGGVVPPLFLVCRLGYGLEERWRTRGRAPRAARVRGTEDGGGAAGPSTVKGEIEISTKNFKN